MAPIIMEGKMLKPIVNVALTVVVATLSAQGLSQDRIADSCAECGEGCCELEGCSFVPCSFDRLFGDEPWLSSLKGRESGNVKWSVGAQVRHRYMDERNRFRPGGIGGTQYDLWRIVPYIDVQYRDIARVHVEAIDASAFNYDVPFFPLFIDENRSDLLEAYADVKLFDTDSGSVSMRYGRQMLKYGSQHLVSPLAWANTYRNFEGYKLFYTSPDWDIDGFAVQPVNAISRNRFQPTSFDNPNRNIWFSGVYATYKGEKNKTLDLYWLWFNEDIVQPRLLGGNRHTLGTRYAGKNEVTQCNKVLRTWDWDFEGAWQFGTDSFLTGPSQDVSAGFVSLIGGHTWNSRAWSPSLKGIFYWGSGDSDPTDSDQNTIYTLYPLAHAYWGILDNLSGQNMFDYGIRGSVKPHEKLIVSLDWHWFDLATAKDFLYNIAGVPFALAPSERHIGTEIDLIGTLKVSPNMNVQLGYSRFFYGDAVTRSAFTRPDANQFYVQTTLTF